MDHSRRREPAPSRRDRSDRPDYSDARADASSSRGSFHHHSKRRESSRSRSPEARNGAASNYRSRDRGPYPTRGGGRDRDRSPRGDRRDDRRDDSRNRGSGRAAHDRRGASRRSPSPRRPHKESEAELKAEPKPEKKSAPAKSPPPPPATETMDMDADEDDTEAQMAAMMGFKGFGTTKQKKVQGNDVGAIAKHKTTEYRQYMYDFLAVISKPTLTTWQESTRRI